MIHVETTVVSDIAQVAEANVNLVLLARPALRERYGASRSFAPDHGPHVARVVTRDQQVELGCGDFGEVDRDLVKADLIFLVRALTRLASCERAKVSLEVIEADSCRRFHVDYVGFRAVVTYAGPGTEWVIERGVRREHLAMPFSSVALVNRKTVPDRSHVRRAKPFDMVLMKGLGAPGNHEGGAVHRSPPIARKRLRRLVLVVTAPVPGG